MLFLGVGVLLLVLKFAEIGPVAAWDWWMVLLPFGLAAAWWAYADATGMTKRRAMDKMEEKKDERRRKAYAAIGLDYRKTDRDRKKADAHKRARKAIVERIERPRAEIRKRNEDTITRASTNFNTLDEITKPPAAAPRK